MYRWYIIHLLYCYVIQAHDTCIYSRFQKSSSITKISYYRRNFTPGIRCYFGLQTSIGSLMGYHHPCLCLCFGFSQITLILPFLLMILHLSQIGLTDALTFIKILSFRKKSIAKNYCNILTNLMQVKFGISLIFFYFSLHLILPFVRSYGDNSSVTLSPGKILI